MPPTSSAAALKYLGYSYNSVKPEEIKKAEELLIANKKNVKVYADDNGQDLLASGEVDIAQEWNGDIIQVMNDDEDLAYVVPTEGSLLWQDTMAIPKGAPHPENAHAFINFILDAEVGAKIAETIQYATANAAAKKLMSKEYLENPAIFPPQEVVAKCEAGIYVGEEGTSCAMRPGRASRRPERRVDGMRLRPFPTLCSHAGGLGPPAGSRRS